MEADGTRKGRKRSSREHLKKQKEKRIKELRLTSGRGVLEGDEEAIIQQREGRDVNPESVRRTTEHVKHRKFNGYGCDVQVHILKAETGNLPT